jgi:hypothetical protein
MMQIVFLDSGSSMSSRLSPSSSGYKSQSQRSDTTTSATPSPTATPVSQLSISGSTQPQVSINLVHFKHTGILKNAVFWDVTPCGSCKKLHFGGLQYQQRGWFLSQ